MTNVRPLPVLSAIVAVAATLAFAWQVRHGAEVDIRTQHRIEAEEKISLVASTLSQTVNVRLNHTRSLAGFVRVKPDLTQEDFERFAEFLQEDLTGLRSLQLAPKGIVKFVTNIEQNRAALGHNLFADPKRRELVERSARNNEYIIAGPVNLLQGGQAIIARRPIYNDDRSFWGFATALIEVEPLFREAGYLKLAETLNMAVRGKDGRGAEGEVFYGDPAVFDDLLATATVVLANGTWQIGAAPRGNQRYEGFVFSGLFTLLSLIVAALIGSAVYVIADRPGRLRVEIDRATADLIEARDAAEAADRAKTEFVSVVSHELRTPLTAIRGSLELLLSGGVGDLNDKARELVTIGSRNSRRLVALVNDILDMNKMLSGELEFNIESVPLIDLLADAIAINQPYADSLQVGLALDAIKEPELAEIVIPCDRARIDQVITNLLSNACKFSPEGDVVRLGAARGPRGSNTIIITVSDNGPGIDPAFREKIFDRFTQADSSDTRKVGGTGLGLYICKLIVELHEGEIDFTSMPDEGTTFSVTLPL